MSTNVSVSHYLYIHNVLGCFFDSMAKFFKNSLFSSSTECVIGTYEKAVQHFQNRTYDGGERHYTKYPFLTLDPSLDFDIEERAGMFLYQYPSYELLKASKQFGPNFYEDENVTISPVLNRYVGTFSLIIWCRSVYEYIDLRILALQFFAGGKGRIIYPVNVDGYFILPDKYLYYDYQNPYTGLEYTLDWSSSEAESILIKTLNQDKWVYPFSLTPWLTLEGAGDGSEKYGGDDLSEYKLVLDIKWETYLPTHLVLVSHKGPIILPNSYFEMETGIVHRFPGVEESVPANVTHIYADPTKEPIHPDGIWSTDVSYKERWEYILTASDVESLNNEENITLEIPEAVSDAFKLKIYHGGSILRVGYNFNLIDSTHVQLLYVDLAGEVTEGNLIDFFIYEDD